MENIVFSTAAFGGFEKSEVLEYIQTQAALEEQLQIDMQFKIDNLVKELQAEQEEKKEFSNENLLLRSELSSTIQKLAEDQQHHRQIALNNQTLELEIQRHKKSIAQQNRKISIQISEIEIDKLETEIDKLENYRQELDAACKHLEEYTQTMYTQLSVLEQKQLKEKSSAMGASQHYIDIAKAEAQQILTQAQKEADSLIYKTEIYYRKALQEAQAIAAKVKQGSKPNYDSDLPKTPIANKFMRGLKSTLRTDDRSSPKD